MLGGHYFIFQASVFFSIVYVFGWVIYCLLFHPLRSISGPLLAKFSRSWIVYKTALGSMEHTQRALHKKHGYLVRIAPNEVSCSDPESIKIIYGLKSGFTKYAGHFGVRDEKLHSERRRIVNSAYSMSSVLESEGAIDSCSEMFCENMRDFARTESVVDICAWSNFRALVKGMLLTPLDSYANDVLGELFFGKKFGFMSERKDIGGLIKAADSFLPANSIGGVLPSYLTKLYQASTKYLSPESRGVLDTFKHIQAAAQAGVAERKEELRANPDDDKHDILRKMLEINVEKGEKVDFTEHHIMIESQSALVAGADTTAAALNAVFYHLMRSPEAYQKLTAEIDAAAANGVLSVPVQYAEASKLPYLKACVNEAMRLHPSVGLCLPREVPAGGATIAGIYFPEGYRVGVNGAVVQYDKDTFGDDSDAYRPERWIEGDAVAMEKVMIPFGAGSRTCLGKNISLSEIYKLVPHVLWEFDIRMPDPRKEWKTVNHWFNRQSGVDMLVTERPH